MTFKIQTYSTIMYEIFKILVDTCRFVYNTEVQNLHVNNRSIRSMAVNV